jgi:hypothetical protein
MGKTIKENHTYKDRLQVTNLRIGPTPGRRLLNLAFYPCSGTATACAAGNTRNIQSQAITVPVPGGSPVTRTQSYAYDSLNRITSLQASITARSGTGSFWPCLRVHIRTKMKSG